MRYPLLLLIAFALSGGLAFGQADSAQNISLAPLNSKALIVDLRNEDELELALKKIHTYKYVESLMLEGEVDEATLKKLIYRLSSLKNLSRLALKDNELKNIPENIISLGLLRSISIEGNTDLDYNDLFLKLSKIFITELVLIDNDLGKVPSGISSMSSLGKIKIVDNDKINYEELIEKLEKLPNLRELAIPVNSISELPKNIVNLRSLQVLDVSENILTELPNEVSSLKNINNLSIQGNLFLNPIKELEKFKESDIRYLSVDKEMSGEDIEKIKKMFPKAEINFPLENHNEAEAAEKDTFPVPKNKEPVKNTGELNIKKDFRILSSAYLAYPALFRNLIYNFDTLTFSERYSALNYSNVYQRLPDSRLLAGMKIRNKLYNKAKLGEIWFQLPPNRAHPFKILGIEIFVNTFNNSATYINYPELAAFAGMYWVYQGDMSRRKFRKKILRKTHSDIRILFDKNNSTFTIELKNDKGFETISAYPVQTKSKKDPIEKSQQTYLRRFLNYERALSRRATQFDRALVRSKRKYNSDFKKLVNYAWKELQLRMSDAEKLMTREEWLSYYDDVIENELSSINNAPLALNYLERGLAIRKINPGVVSERSNFLKPVQVDFVNAVGETKLAVSSIILVDTKNKTYIRIPGTFGLTPMSLNLKQFAGYCIFVELRSGNIGVVNAIEIDRQALEPNQQYSIKCKVFDKNLDSIGDCLKEAGLN